MECQGILAIPRFVSALRLGHDGTKVDQPGTILNLLRGSGGPNIEPNQGLTVDPDHILAFGNGIYT